ncbi:hypothetical protein EXIGLDRAFT_382111 [Exidia glandulosa HHB12029]|uniref:Uncharacterized protein n=1 Tax=Exidia glandulosa HHB12029 TaxID=1314781 RepID=A0A165BZ03_EXIGL|nr:hypothetical protein EXIGLDRAFT_382111 [Exidia glandulosa HHB12029]
MRRSGPRLVIISSTGCIWSCIWGSVQYCCMFRRSRHYKELLYLDRQGSSTMQFTTGATNEPRIVPVDDAASLLWAMRYTIAIFTRYGTPELREIMMSKPTPTTDDQGKKRKRDSSTSPEPRRKRRDGDDSHDSQREPDDSVGSSHSTLADASPEELKEMVLKFARCASPARALPLQSTSDSASSETDSSDDEASMSDVDTEAGAYSATSSLRARAKCDRRTCLHGRGQDRGP